MSRPLLSAFALISLIALGVLALGCFAEFGPAYLHNIVGGPRPHALDVELQLQRGRVAIYWETWNNPPARFFVPTGTHIYWHPVRFRSPDLRRSFWEFDAHPLIPAKGLWVFLLAFPIWCAAIPCLIAPLMWLRKRRTTQFAAFPVELINGN
ncbi:MAG TPA: hypothetical protein VHX86_14450 [Tepidisphaeraceae bacterium]|jgi:hypothetical protein|nr:hypothetical protein [Tepidisphaeraceae bacterium]